MKSCQSCKHELRISVLPESNTPIELQDGKNKGKLITLEINGVKLLEWNPSASGYFVVPNESDEKFAVEDFDGKYWLDFDDKS